MNTLDKSAKIATIAFAAIAVAAAAEMAGEILVPALAALVVGIVMSPVTDRLNSMGLPSAAGALLSLVLILLAIGALALFLEPVAYNAIEAGPRIIDEINRTISQIRWELRGIEDISERVTEAIGDGAGQGAAVDGDASAAKAAIPSISEAIFMAPAILSQIMIFVGVLFFFILTKGQTYAFVAERLVSDAHRFEAVQRLRGAERQVGRYFLTVSVINAGYAVVVTVVMMLIGLPSPLLWGIAAGLLNYVLYLGPAAMIVSLLLAGLVVFDGSYSFFPALAYLIINILEAQFITPSLVGRSLQVNPLLIFCTLVFLLWLWGPVGGIIAIPLLLWVIVLVDGIRDVRRYGQAGEGDDDKEQSLLARVIQ